MKYLTILLLFINASNAQDKPNKSVKAEPRAASVVLNWTASTTSGVDYFIYRASGACNSATNFTKINTTTITTVTYTDSGMTGGIYCYYVTSHLATSNPSESYPSNTAEAAVQNPPNPPTNLTVTPATVSLVVGEQQQFTAKRDSTNVQPNWSISPQEGTISSSGLYKAPNSIQGNNISVQVIAKDSEGSGTASITLRKK